MQTAYVRPAVDAEGKPMLVRQPDRGWLPLPPEGEWVILDEYWTRRIRDQDVKEGEPPLPPEVEPAPPPAEPNPPASPETASDTPARAKSRT